MSRSDRRSLREPLDEPVQPTEGLLDWLRGVPDLIEADPVVYIGFGQRHDGKSGPGWVLALCGPTPAEVNSRAGSPCVAEARQRLADAGEQPTPSTYEEWAGEE